MNFQLNSSEGRISVVIFGIILFFYFYYYLAHSRYLYRFAENKYKQNSQKELFRFFMQKPAGFALLGVITGIPYYFFASRLFDQFGFTLLSLKSNTDIILVLTVILVLVLYFTQKANPQRSSLQIDLKEWTPNLFLFNALGWTLYLIGYEFLFRGILLYECFAAFGFWPAIVVSVVIYSAIHLVNGKDQAIGALVFGTIACYFVLTSGTLLIPVFMHISLSVFSDYFSIRLNPKLGFVKSGESILH